MIIRNIICAASRADGRMPFPINLDKYLEHENNLTMTKMKHNTMMIGATTSPAKADVFLKCVGLLACFDTLCREEPGMIGSTYFHIKV